jgi:hypothetical protein
MPHICSNGYCNGGGLIRVVRRIVDDESASGADIATNQALVVGIDQTEQTLSIPHQCRKEYCERVKQIYRWSLENQEMSMWSKSVNREANFDTGELSLTNITKERWHTTTTKIWKR